MIQEILLKNKITFIYSHCAVQSHWFRDANLSILNGAVLREGACSRASCDNSLPTMGAHLNPLPENTNKKA